MKFEWSKVKSSANLRKHGIDFRKSVSIFLVDHIVLELLTRDEPCWAAIGKIERKFYTAIFTRRAGKIRFISVRRSRKNEEAHYGKFFKKKEI